MTPMDSPVIVIVLCAAFILISVIKSEKDRKNKAHTVSGQQTGQGDVDSSAAAPVSFPEQDGFQNEGIPQTAAAENIHDAAHIDVKPEKSNLSDLDFDPEKMIIYSEILKPKF